MEFSSYENLLLVANNLETDIDKLLLLQKYFLENVEFDHIFGIAAELDDEKIANRQTAFATPDEKERELLNFEKQYGDNFHFSPKDRLALLELLGTKTEPVKVARTWMGKTVYTYVGGSDGSIYDCIRTLSNRPSVYENGLIKKGLCSTFSSFVKQYCDDLGIKCSIAHVSGHMFNIIEIDGVRKVFDFARMIGIRDGYKVKGQAVDEWFNMTFAKMFEYKPERKIKAIDDIDYSNNPITIENYQAYFPEENETIKKH